MSASEQIELVNEDRSLQMSSGKKFQVETESPSKRRTSMIALGIIFV